MESIWTTESAPLYRLSAQKCSLLMKYLLAGAGGHCPAHILLWGRQEMLWEDKTEYRRGNGKYRGEAWYSILFPVLYLWLSSLLIRRDIGIFACRWYFRKVIRKVGISEIKLIISKLSNQINPALTCLIQETFGKLISFNAGIIDVQRLLRVFLFILCKSHQFISYLFSK